MDLKPNLLKNTLLSWIVLVLVKLLLSKVTGYSPFFGITNYIFVALILFYISLLFNLQFQKRNLIKNDNGNEIGGSLSIIFNVFLCISFIIVLVALILQEATLLRGPLLLLIAHSYVENNSVVIGNKYMSLGFSVFLKDQIDTYVITNKKQNKSVLKVILNNNRHISVTRNKYEIAEIEKLLVKTKKTSVIN